MTSRLRIRSLFLPLTTVVLIIAQLIQPSGIWKGFLTVAGGLWLIAYLWAHALRRNLRLERAMRFGWAQVGDKLEELFIVQNEGFLPATWLEISDHSTLPGYSVARATGLDGHSQNSWTTSGTCARRGIYTLGETRLATGDPFGIYEVELAQHQAVTVTVLPPVIPLPFKEATSSGWQGDHLRRTRAVEQTVSAETVRTYTPGDSLHLIHWPTSTRRNEPYVRVLEGAAQNDWLIALDFERRIQQGDDEAESTAELAVILAASLADRGLRAHRAVGLIASGEQPVWMAKPEAGEHRRWEIMRALAELRPGETNLARMLEAAGTSLASQASLLIVTTSTESDWLKPLAHLFWRGIIPTAILIDPSTFGAEENMQSLSLLMNESGIPHHIVGRELFNRPEARPGPSGQWEWLMLPTGKAVPIRRPSDLSWKRLQ